MPAQITDFTDSLVVEIGSGSANESIVKLEVDEEKSNDFDKTSWGIFAGDIICYGPWDDENLFARVRNSEMKRDHSMGRYRWYINYLLKIINSVGKPLGYSRRLRQPSYELGGGELSCPSLTDSSTVSESPFWISAALKRLGRSNPSMSLDEEAKRRDLGESTYPRKQYRIETIAFNGLGARFWTLPSRLEHLDLSDAESLTDTSSEDDDEEEDDPFDILHQAIRKAFSPNTQLAEKIINYLHQLPPDRRAQVYGYGYHTTSAGDSHGPGRPHNQDCDGDDSRRRKRKRTNDPSPSSSGNNQVDEDNDQENQLEVARHPSTAPPEKRYACAYYKSDGGKYSPRAGSRYKSCAGPGWKLLNHYKRHLERVHLLHQCSRCGEIFEKSDVLHSHLARDPRCNRSEGIEPEGMSQQRWDELRKIFKKTPRRQDNPSDEEKWFLAWDFLFPHMERPPTPYYEKTPLHPAFTRMQGVFEASLSTMPLIAHNPGAQDEIMSLLANAIEAATQTAPLELEAYNHNNDLLPAPPPILDNPQMGQNNYIEANPHDFGTAFDWNHIDPGLENGSISNDPFADYVLDLDAFEADVDANGDAEGT